VWKTGYSEENCSYLKLFDLRVYCYTLPHNKKQAKQLSGTAVSWRSWHAWYSWHCVTLIQEGSCWRSPVKWEKISPTCRPHVSLLFGRSSLDSPNAYILKTKRWIIWKQKILSVLNSLISSSRASWWTLWDGANSNFCVKFTCLRQPIRNFSAESQLLSHRGRYLVACNSLVQVINWLLSFVTVVMLSFYLSRIVLLRYSGLLCPSVTESLQQHIPFAAVVVGFVMTITNTSFIVSLLVFFFTSSKLTKFRAARKVSLDDSQGALNSASDLWISVSNWRSGASRGLSAVFLLIFVTFLSSSCANHKEHCVICQWQEYLCFFFPLRNCNPDPRNAFTFTDGCCQMSLELNCFSW